MDTIIGGSLGLLIIIIMIGTIGIEYTGLTILAFMALGCLLFIWAFLEDTFLHPLRQKQAESRMRKQEETERQEEERRLEQEKQNKRVLTEQAASLAYESVSSWLSERFVLDSNIWMNRRYDDFFLLLEFVCKQRGHTLLVSREQLEEILNVKKASSYGKTKNRDSRIALARIERFQKSKCLRIDEISKPLSQKPYLDPIIHGMVISDAKEHRSVTLLTDDRELRIRIRQQLQDLGLDKICAFVELSEWLPEFEKAVRWYRLGMDTSSPSPASGELDDHYPF